MHRVRAGRIGVFCAALSRLVACSAAPASAPQGDTEPAGSTTGSVDDAASGSETGDGSADATTTSGEADGSSDTTGDGSTGAADRGTFGMPAEPMPCPPGVRPGTLEIGHGSGEFVPLDDGPAQLVHGRQGGFHIVLGVHAPGLDTVAPGTANLRGIVDGVVLADHPFVANLTCDDETLGAQALWINLILDSTPAQLHDKVVEIEIELVDAAGTVVEGTASVRIVDPLAPG